MATEAQCEKASGRKRPVVGLLVAVALVLAALAAARLLAPRGERSAIWTVAGEAGRYETGLTVMDTDARLQVAASSERQARRYFDAATRQLRTVEAEMSTFLPDSEVSRLNRLGGRSAVELSDTTLRVLRSAAEAARLTGGAFDVTYAPLRELWWRAQREDRLPTADELKDVLRRVGYRKLLFDGNRVRFAEPGMEVDLGGIAKGYAIDRAVEAMVAAGAKSGFVDVGGDLRLFGVPASGGRWSVAVRRPPGVERAYVLRVPACAVTTSGDYERSFTVRGKRYSHIVDPRTGWPVAHMCSVTVVAPDATTADALSTGVSVLGVEHGLALIDSLERVECMIMVRHDDGTVTVHMSKGFGGLLGEP